MLYLLIHMYINIYMHVTTINEKRGYDFESEQEGMHQ